MSMSVKVFKSSGDLRLESFEMMKVARQLMRTVFRTKKGRNALVMVHEEVWAYVDDTKWMKLSTPQVEDLVMRNLENAFMEVSKKGGQEIETKRWADDGAGSFVRKSREVVRCLETLIRVDAEKAIPFWLGGDREGMPAEKCIGFRDKVVCVEGGVLRSVERDERWFSPGYVDVEFDEDAVSPLWEQCLEDWMPGDEGGKELYRRWYGYCMMGYRGYARSLLQLGRTRSGKGTGTNVCKALVGASRYHGKLLEDLSTDWAFEGLEAGGVLVISEMSELTQRESQSVAKVIKACNGEDTVDVNVKYGKKKPKVRLQVAPWFCGNEMPQLSNRGQGLSGKILPLKFNVSFLGKENLNLERDLLEEKSLQGIAAWAVRGALNLEAASQEDRWPRCVAADEVIRDMLMANNVYEMFLQAQFVENKDGFVENSVVKGLWAMWCKTENVTVKGNNLHLPGKLKEECSWSLETKKIGGKRGLKGLSLRKDGKRGERDEGL